MQGTLNNDGLHSTTNNTEWHKGGKQQPLEQELDMDLMEDDQDDMDIGELDLDGLEKVVQYLEQGVIPSQ